MGDTLGVIVPSRGLMFSQTFEELVNELKDFKYKIFWAHGKKIPDCFNDPTEEALADPDVFAVLFVEDDMIIPKGAIMEMFNMGYPVVAYDYPFKDNGDSTMLHDPEEFAYWSGTGLMLVARAILENMKKPIWRTDTAWDIFIRNSQINIWPRPLKKVAYGLHDVNFGIILYSQGVPIMSPERTAGQRKLKKLGRAKVNNGAHEIKELRRVGRDMVIKTLSADAVLKFKEALKRIGSVNIMDSIPDYVAYKDGQAHLVTGEKYDII